jgi:dethiobiotin synthetase
VTSQIIFVTGTDTGVGKTVIAAELTRQLRKGQRSVVALKPICSGDRADARALRAAAGGTIALDKVNPWHFRAALAPMLAARRERRPVALRDVVAHIRRMASMFGCAVVEGAGGLLSPLGEGFDSRDLIRALKATPIIVAPNRLGAVNQVRLVLDALPHDAARKARIVLISQKSRDAAASTNAALLAEYIRRERIHEVFWRTRANQDVFCRKVAILGVSVTE